jgi:hypothetical protein
MQDWLLGFVSAQNFRESRDLLGGLDSQSVWEWTDDYCRTRPTDTLVQAALALMDEKL